MKLTQLTLSIALSMAQMVVCANANSQETGKRAAANASITSTPTAPSAKSGYAVREKIVIAMPKTYGKTETMGLWGDYFNHLSRCGNIDLQNANGESLANSTNIDTMAEKDLIEAVKSGKAQMAQVNPGLAAQLVTAGNPAPFVVPGNKASGLRNSYKLILITRVDSGLIKPTDLIGKKVAHTTPTSNSGNLAPRALFPAIGLTPEKDYEVVFSNGHERSVVGVLHGFWPAAAVASDLYQRMVVKGEVRASSFRVMWESPPFMTESWVMGKDLSADVQGRLRKCSLNYSFSPNLRKLLPGNDSFLPVNFDRDFATVMEVYRKNQAAAERK